VIGRASFPSEPFPLLDAGVGARLLAAGLDPRHDDPCLWSLDRPAAVLALHRADHAAGAVALTTNTFGANSVWLDRFGRGSDADRLNRAAVALARDAAGPTGYVLGSIGPTAARDPAALNAQAETLLDAGADALLLETVAPDSGASLLAALRGLRARVIVSLLGDPGDDAIDRLCDAGVFALGANCVPIDRVGQILQALRRRFDGPLLARPGRLPAEPIGDPDAWASALIDALPAGPVWLGGCCGIDAAHLAALARAVPHRRPAC
jgi:methionine synthase I (cobalamin-dependent)